MYCNDLQYMRITSLAPLATCKVYTANCCGIILLLLLTATNKKNTVDCMHSVCMYVCNCLQIVLRNLTTCFV